MIMIKIMKKRIYRTKIKMTRLNIKWIQSYSPILNLAKILIVQSLYSVLKIKINNKSNKKIILKIIIVTLVLKKESNNANAIIVIKGNSNTVFISKFSKSNKNRVRNNSLSINIKALKANLLWRCLYNFVVIVLSRKIWMIKIMKYKKVIYQNKRKMVWLFSFNLIVVNTI